MFAIVTVLYQSHQPQPQETMHMNRRELAELLIKRYPRSRHSRQATLRAAVNGVKK